MPRNAIDEEKFVNILVDVHIAQALYNDRARLKIDSLRSDELYLSVLKKHNVSEDEMNATTLYYTRHPKKYDKIFSKVLSEISLLQEEENKDPNIIIEEKN
jgi:hypothetical protein